MTITQITLFNFISALVLGELVGNALYDKEVGLLEILVGIFSWGILMFSMQLITQKSMRARKFLEGRPTIIVYKGKIRHKVLKKNRIDLNQFMHLLRDKNTFSIREVEFAVLETDGTINVVKKSDYEIPTKADHGMPKNPPSLPIAVISDGQLIKENLRRSGLNEIWLKKELRKKGIDHFPEVFYAEWKEGDSLYVETYNC